MNKHERAGAFAKKFFPLLAALAIGVLAGATVVNERYQIWQLSDDYTVRLPPGETPDNICKQLAAAEARRRGPAKRSASTAKRSNSYKQCATKSLPRSITSPCSCSSMLCVMH